MTIEAGRSMVRSFDRIVPRRDSMSWRDLLGRRLAESLSAVDDMNLKFTGLKPGFAPLYYAQTD